MTSVKDCDGGHPCNSPQECCKEGCCDPLEYPHYRPPSLPTGNMFTPLFLGHWYFWAAITATLAGILCACSLWRRRSSRFCCKDAGRDERASEPDSNGSCYAPPQYSRCSSFHQAPPPYSEVTSKPDLYPLVISYNGDTVIKNNGTSTGYLMVQYFRNFIVRPVGSLSATSTIDSLSSSFICNAANEANTIVPPPYSCTGSLEEVNPIPNTTAVPFSRSVSSVTCNEYHQVPPQPSPGSARSHSSGQAPISSHHSIPSAIETNDLKYHTIDRNSLLIHDNPCYAAAPLLPEEINPDLKRAPPVEFFAKNTLPYRINKKIVANRSVDSESQEEDHNFSDLLNLSVCAPESALEPPCGRSTIAERSFSVANSMTGSDISSLANLGTPDSPPRATSPTSEMKELLDKIQQLPQQKSPSQEAPHHVKLKGYFSRAKAKTLYMPLNDVVVCENKQNGSKVSPGVRPTINKKGWLSRSAPNTPCGNFFPTFPAQQKPSNSQKGSRVRVYDGSPLLNENDESDEDNHKDECL